MTFSLPIRKPKRRTNIYLSEDLLATLDAYARVAEVSRTELIHHLLMPSKPVLDKLLEKADDYFRISDEQKFEARRQFDRLESSVFSMLGEVSQKVDEL